MLQGPIGGFFDRLAQVLRSHGQQVWKVHFNGGDEWFWHGPGGLRFAHPLALWRPALQALIAHLQVDALVLFGQSRPAHEVAIDVARRRGVTVYVFEEGYVRPDYVTLEIGGVNGQSCLSRRRAFYDRLEPVEPVPPVPTRQRFGRTARLAVTYALATALGRRAYPHYRHHRSLDLVAEALRWTRGGIRKAAAAWRDRDALSELATAARGAGWFLVPLQVSHDQQVRRFSPFDDVPAFIDCVIRSFARHAPAGMGLVFKHHPLDRPYADHRAQVTRLARDLGLGGRVRYVHDPHLPSLLRLARGVVTVNSTTGLQALWHGTPVIVLGACVYAVEGLVHAGPLERFWSEPGRVDAALFQRFRSFLVRETQLNASFYAEAPGLGRLEADAASGVRPAVA